MKVDERFNQFHCTPTGCCVRQQDLVRRVRCHRTPVRPIRRERVENIDDADDLREKRNFSC
jgi:hypothetical protein